MIEAPLIAFEGRLTDAEKQTLHQLKDTEPFKLLRKLCAEQYHIITMKVTTCETERQMTLAQGQLLGVQGIYNMLMSLGSPKNKETLALPIHKKLLQDSKKRGS